MSDGDRVIQRKKNFDHLLYFLFYILHSRHSLYTDSLKLFLTFCNLHSSRYDYTTLSPLDVFLVATKKPLLLVLTKPCHIPDFSHLPKLRQKEKLQIPFFEAATPVSAQTSRTSRVQ